MYKVFNTVLYLIILILCLKLDESMFCYYINVDPTIPPTLPPLYNSNKLECKFYHYMVLKISNIGKRVT